MSMGPGATVVVLDSRGHPSGIGSPLSWNPMVGIGDGPITGLTVKSVGCYFVG